MVRRAWSWTQRGRTQYGWGLLHIGTLALAPWDRVSFLGPPTDLAWMGRSKGSPTEMGQKTWELFPKLLWALHSYVLLCSKVPMTSRLWTVILWKGSWLRTSGCESSKIGTWVSSHLGRTDWLRVLRYPTPQPR